MSNQALAVMMVALAWFPLPASLTRASRQGEQLPPKIGAILRSEDREEFERTHRPLLIFAPTDLDPTYREQMGRIEEAKDDLGKRDVFVVSLFKQKGGNAGGQKLDMADAAVLRRRYKVDGDDFVVLLIGKDGLEKSRKRRPVEIKALFAEIDALSDGPPK